MKLEFDDKEIVFLEDFSLNTMGGGQRITANMINFYRKNRIIIFHIGNAKIFNNLIKNKNVSYKEIKIPWFLDRRSYLIILIYKLFFKRYKNIVANTRMTSLALQIIGCFKKKRRYIILQHLSPRYSFTLNLISRYFNQISNCEHILVTDFLMKKYKNSKLIPKSQNKNWSILNEVNVNLPNKNISLKNFPILAESNIQIQSEKKTITFGYLGLINSKKGIFELINLLNKVQKDRIIQKKFNINLLIFGDGPLKDVSKLKELIKISNIQIKYFGRIAISQMVYKNFDATIIPSWDIEETLSFTALESIKYCKFTLLAPNGVLNNYIDNDKVLKFKKSPLSLKKLINKIAAYL